MPLLDLAGYYRSRNIHVDHHTALEDVLKSVRHVAVQQAVRELAARVQSTLKGGTNDLEIIKEENLRQQPDISEVCRGLDAELREETIRSLCRTFETAVTDAVWKDMTGSYPLEDETIDEQWGMRYQKSFEDVDTAIVQYLRGKKVS